MLKHWDTHAEYQHFISEAVTLLNQSQLKRLNSMSDSWNKLPNMPSGMPSLRRSCLSAQTTYESFWFIVSSFPFTCYTVHEDIRILQSTAW